MRDTIPVTIDMKKPLNKNLNKIICVDLAVAMSSHFRYSAGILKFHTFKLFFKVNDEFNFMVHIPYIVLEIFDHSILSILITESNLQLFTGSYFILIFINSSF